MNKEIFKIIEKNDFEEFRLFLNDKTYSEYTNLYNKILDFLCKSKEKYQMFKLVLEMGVDTNHSIYYKEKFYPIHVIIETDGSEYNDGWLNEINTEKLELLIKHGADINKATNEGFTPLDVSIISKNKQAEILLKKLGAKYSKVFVFSEWYEIYFPNSNPNDEKFIETYISDDYIQLPSLHAEIRNTSLPKPNLRFLENIIKRDNNINSLDYKSRTPLDYAVEKEHYLAKELLLKYKARHSKEINQQKL